jgi:hypothetical protein
LKTINPGKQSLSLLIVALLVDSKMAVKQATNAKKLMNL